MATEGLVRSMTSSTVWADIPSCGLGNKLLVWAKAAWYAHSHQLPLVVSGWNNYTGLRTWVRGGGVRWYNGDFVGSGLSTKFKLLLSKLVSNPIDEPALQDTPETGALYRFNSVPHWSDYFGYFNAGQPVLSNSLWDLVSARRRNEIEQSPEVDVAVHIRHGDFRTLMPGEEFAKVGHVRTSSEYFSNVIENVRFHAQRPVRVTIFSDGKDADLKDVLSLPNVERANSAKAIVDIFRMAKSKLLVCSAGSTFSYWSAFIGSQPVILHRDHIHQPIRKPNQGNSPFEGGVPEDPSEWPKQLIDQIQATQWRC